jgi:hypothetical protein
MTIANGMQPAAIGPVAIFNQFNHSALPGIQPDRFFTDGEAVVGGFSFATKAVPPKQKATNRCIVNNCRGMNCVGCGSKGK